MVSLALHPLSERARIVHGPRKMADGLSAGLCRVGSDRRDRLSADVRIHLTGHTFERQRSRVLWRVAVRASEIARVG